MRPSAFNFKIIRSNSGLFYLIVIVLSAAVAANVFRKNDGILLVPVVMVIAVILLTMFTRKRWARGVPR